MNGLFGIFETVGRSVILNDTRCHKTCVVVPIGVFLVCPIDFKHFSKDGEQVLNRVIDAGGVAHDSVCDMLDNLVIYTFHGHVLSLVVLDVLAYGCLDGLRFRVLFVEPFGDVLVGRVEGEGERPRLLPAVPERGSALCFRLSHLHPRVLVANADGSPRPAGRTAERVQLETVYGERLEDVRDIALVFVVDLRPSFALIVEDEPREGLESVLLTKRLADSLAFEHLLMGERWESNVFGPYAIVDVDGVSEIPTVAVGSPFDGFVTYEVEFEGVHLLSFLLAYILSIAHVLYINKDRL